MSSFAGKHVVVTGGAGALGGAIVGRLVELGAQVHVPVFESTLPAVSWGQTAVQFTEGVDLTDEAAVTRFYVELPALWASIHAAGGFAMEPIESTSCEAFRRQIDMNVTTAFLSCREATKVIRRSGQGGRIINVAARPALTPVPGMTAYAVAKAGVAALTRSLAVELAPENILVNAVVPSMIDTPSNRAAMPDADHTLWPSPADIAETVAFLASVENQLTHGALVPVYGRV